MSVGELIAGLGSLGIFALIFSIIYDAFFHPLVSIPGPFIRRVSQLPQCLSILRGNVVCVVNDLHARYGPVVRVAPNEISFIKSEAWNSIYAQSRGYTFKKDTNFYGGGLKKAQSLVTQRDKPSHIRIRGKFGKAFTPNAIKDQEDLLLKHAEAMLEYVEAQRESNDSIVNLVNVYMFAQLQTTLELLFGSSADSLKPTDADFTRLNVPMFDALRSSARTGALKRILPGLIAKSLILIFTPSTIQSAQKHIRNTAYLIDRRLSRKGDDIRTDIWSALMEDHGDSKLSYDEMIANGSAFLIAGSETTTTVLSTVSYFLARHPETYQNLKEEVRGKFKHNKQLDLASIQDLVYLNACIKEGMRLCPPSPLGLPRLVPPGGSTICQHVIPGGTTVYVSQYAAYRNPRNFHRPQEFLPQRWLEEEECFADDDRSIFQPFSVGPRNCIGKTLAWHEARLLLVSMVLAYDFELVPESADFLDQRVFLTWEKAHLLMRIIPSDPEEDG